jgi:endoglucanase
MNVHHRISGADGIKEPIPGMMVGGPNNHNLDDCGTDAYKQSDRAALAYLDKQCSYSTNEVAINWNASLAYVVCSISANPYYK